MSYQEVLSQRAVAVSISESADLAVLGLGDEHLVDAMTEVARHLLALGARLYYGGDLRPEGFTEVLLELALRHRRDADIGDRRPSVTNVLAWPVFASTPVGVLARMREVFGPMAELVWLDPAGRPQEGVPDEFSGLRPETVDVAQWVQGLTAMREFVTRACDARVVLGGRRTGFRGRMPGVLEEALSALESRRPLYVLGGFGGCAGDLGTWLGLRERHPRGGDDVRTDEVEELFQGFTPDDLRNGLSVDENRVLASTVHLDQAVALLLRGLARAVGQERPLTDASSA